MFSSLNKTLCHHYKWKASTRTKSTAWPFSLQLVVTNKTPHSQFFQIKHLHCSNAKSLFCHFIFFNRSETKLLLHGIRLCQSWLLLSNECQNFVISLNIFSLPINLTILQRHASLHISHVPSTTEVEQPASKPGCTNPDAFWRFMQI